MKWVQIKGGCRIKRPNAPPQAVFAPKELSVRTSQNTLARQIRSSAIRLANWDRRKNCTLLLLLMLLLLWSLLLLTAGVLCLQATARLSPSSVTPAPASPAKLSAPCGSASAPAPTASTSPVSLFACCKLDMTWSAASKIEFITIESIFLKHCWRNPFVPQSFKMDLLDISPDLLCKQAKKKPSQSKNAEWNSNLLTCLGLHPQASPATVRTASSPCAPPTGGPTPAPAWPAVWASRTTSLSSACVASATRALASPARGTKGRSRWSRSVQENSVASILSLPTFPLSHFGPSGSQVVVAGGAGSGTAKRPERWDWKCFSHSDQPQSLLLALAN